MMTHAQMNSLCLSDWKQSDRVKNMSVPVQLELQVLIFVAQNYRPTRYVENEK